MTDIVITGGRGVVNLRPVMGKVGPGGTDGTDGADGLPGVNAVPADTAVAGYISTTGTSETKTALSAAYEQGDTRILHVSTTGDDAANGQTVSTAKATIAGALAAMGLGVKGVIKLGPGDIPLGSASLSWTGYKCGVVGQGSQNTRIVATAQTGPMLDLTGVNYDLNDSTFGGFTLYGDGLDNTANQGLALDPDTSIVNASFYDIVCRNTGGTPFDLGYAELCTFTKLYAFEPINAAVNDTPYFSAAGAFNGNTFRDCVLHGLSAGASVGVSGAVVIKDNGSTAPHANNLDTFKFEYLHVPTGGTIVSITGNDNEVNHPQFFDNSKVAGATDTSHIRFNVPLGMDSGGNKVLGVIPGKGTNTTDLDCGVDVRQSRNAIVGVKGYRGTNVILAAGVARSYVEVHGSAAASGDPAVIDNSGDLTNTIVDHYLHTEKRPARTITQGTTSLVMDIPGSAWGQGGVRFYDPAVPANGTVGIGTSGVRTQAIGAMALATADTVRYRTIGLVNVAEITSVGVKGLRLYDSGALPVASATYRGVIANLQGAAGVADRLVICRKDAADAYAWVDLF